jgi:hypothetical protein
MITIPTGRPIFEGEIATYWMDDGILVSVSKSPTRTVANIRNNIAFVKQITGNKKVPLLIYLTSSPVPDKETRKFSSEQLPSVYTAMAMISDPRSSAVHRDPLRREIPSGQVGNLPYNVLYSVMDNRRVAVTSSLYEYYGYIFSSMRGKAVASRRWWMSQIQVTVRSTPRPKPTCGTLP